MGRAALFVESMRSTGLRKLVAVRVHEELAARFRCCSVATDLRVDVLVVRLRLWWPWLLLLGLAHLVVWLRARRVVTRVLREVQVPMRVSHVRVGSIKKRPRRR